MDWPQMLDTFARMPAAEQQAWWRMAAGLLAVVVALLWLESRYFKPSRRVGSWLAVRLVSVLAALLAVAAVLLPARAVGGPAALGVFVLSLYTLGPVVWFGGHVLAGRWVRPALSRAESLVLGLTGLAIAAVPVYASLVAQSALQTAARDVAQRRELPATNPRWPTPCSPCSATSCPAWGSSTPSHCWAPPTPACCAWSSATAAANGPRTPTPWPTPATAPTATTCT